MSAPLILAIQPDRRQQSQLASIARRISAELLLTESAERAMAVLGERLPDLILTPALLSHRDEMALTERLRQFGDAAAHIQTLTIPILETAASPSRKGVLSALRKQKRKGKAGAAETVGCTADTFAEQISIYLTRATEARRINLKLQVQAAATAEAPPPEPQLDPELGRVEADGGADLVPAKLDSRQSQHHGIPEPENVSQPDGRPRKIDELPSIEELSAKTPAVPEPDRSVETRIDPIAVTAHGLSAMPAPPAASVETSMEAVAAMVPDVDARAVSLPVPTPVVMPQVAELAMELPAAEMAASGEALAAVPAIPAASVETSMEAVAAMVPGIDARAVSPAVPMPAVMPRVAELAMELNSVDMAASVREVSAMPPLAATPVETSMEAVAAMVPIGTAVNDRPVPTPALMPRVAELPIELPAAETAPFVDEPVTAVPVFAGSVDACMEAIAAMAPVTGAAAGDRPVPMPAVMLPVAQLPIRLLATDMVASVHTVGLAVPQPAGLVEMSMQAVAGIVPLVSDQADNRLAMPAVMSRVAELSMELSPSEIAASANERVLVMPELPAGPMETSMEAVAAILPLASAEAHSRLVPMPVVMPHVAALPIELPSMAASPSADPAVLVVPGHPADPARTSMETVAAMVDGLRAPADEGRAPTTSPAATLPVRKKAKKKVTLKARKAARKNGKQHTDALDTSSLFDPDECRFSALLAKLDEVASPTDESHPSASDAGRQARRKPGRPAKQA